jgi:8-oxo-dGTP pyrophosphatase MutT (NUDIX family)
MTKEKLFFVGVKGLIENSQGQILLLHADVTTHRKNTEPYWAIPGGRIEEGNTVVETLEREIEEETGITELQNVEHIGTVISKHQIPLAEGRNAGLVLMIYKVEIPADVSIIISAEHTEFAWVDRYEAAKRLQNKYPQEFIDLLLQ